MQTQPDSLSSAQNADLPRPDVDIAEDVQQLTRTYPPLNMSRMYLHTQVKDGVVTVTGNIRSAQGKRHLHDHVPKIAGVKSVDLSGLYDDEAVTIAIGDKLPENIYATVYYGMVSLSGSLSTQTDSQTLLNAVGTVPGVRKVTAQFDQR